MKQQNLTLQGNVIGNRARRLEDDTKIKLKVQ